jgi:putative transposase
MPIEHPQRLHHDIPGWVRDGALFHIRIRAGKNWDLIGTGGVTAAAILAAAEFYHDNGRWWCRLVLVMPDHVHAMLAFPRDAEMGKMVGAWKGHLARQRGVKWQSGFFDHRLRSRKEADECWHYIMQNPVLAGLEEAEDAWPWRWRSERAAAPE